MNVVGGDGLLPKHARLVVAVSPQLPKPLGCQIEQYALESRNLMTLRLSHRDAKDVQAADEKAASKNNQTLLRHWNDWLMTRLGETRCRHFGGPARARVHWLLN
jgi:hypothetical protein